MGFDADLVCIYVPKIDPHAWLLYNYMHIYILQPYKKFEPRKVISGQAQVESIAYQVKLRLSMFSGFWLT